MKAITAKVIIRGGISYLRLPEELVFPESTLLLEEISPGKFLISRDPWIGVKDAAQIVLEQNRNPPKERENAWSSRRMNKRK